MGNKKQYQNIKSKNQDFRNKLEDLEDKLDELIISEEVSKDNKKTVFPSKTKKKMNALVEPVLIKRGYISPVRRVAIFGTLKVKLLKLTLLTVDIPNLNVDLKRFDKQQDI